MGGLNQIVELPIGRGGLTSSRNQSQVTRDKLVVANNITYESGTISKIGGASKFNSSQLQDASSDPVKILSGFEWIPSSETFRQIVLTSEGKLLRDTGDGSFATTLKSSLSVSNNEAAFFVPGGKEAAANNRKLFIFTGENVVQVIDGDGTSTSDISTPPTDWASYGQPLNGCIHEGRLWAFAGHVAYYSTTADHEDFSGAGSGTIPVYPGEGEEICFGVSFRSRLVVVKKNKGIYVIDTTDPSDSNWRVDTLTDSIGCRSPLGFTRIDNSLAFVDDSGQIQLLSTVSNDSGVFKSDNISELTETDIMIRDDFSFNTSPKKARLHYYSSKRQLWYGLSGLGASDNNRIIIYEFQQDAVKPAVNTRDTPVSIWSRTISNELKPVVGDNNGYIWDMDEVTRSKDGLGYEAEFQSPHDDLASEDLRLAAINKTGQFLEVVVEPLGNWDLSVDILWDGEQVATKSFNLGVTGAALGSFTLGTDRLGGSQVLNKKRKIEGQGRRFSIRGRNSGEGEDFSIARFYVHFIVNEESLRE